MALRRNQQPTTCDECTQYDPKLERCIKTGASVKDDTKACPLFRFDPVMALTKGAKNVRLYGNH